jgi:antitoxin (DNA-binding transcriptional repressor) of toxin-antitoxin stability system
MRTYIWYGTYVTASELRSQIYKVLDQVLETGVPVEIMRKGRKILISPADEDGTKLSRLIRRDDVLEGDSDSIVHMDWSTEWRP